MNHPFKILIAVISFTLFFASGIYAVPFAKKWINPLEKLPQDLKRSKDITTKDCREALLKDPENPVLHACVAGDEMKKEQWNAAAKHWEEAIRLSKDKPITSYYLVLTWTYGKMKKHSAAMETIQEALRAHTMGGAYAEHQETVKGSIEVGKLADLAVWREDPYTAPLKGFYQIPIDVTMVGGEIIYQA